MEKPAHVDVRAGRPAAPPDTPPAHYQSASAECTRTRVLKGLLVLAILYTLTIGKSFFIPLTLSLLLSFVFAPAVVALEHIHVPRSLGAGLLVLSLVTVMGLGVRALADPLESWMERAPHMLNELELKVYPLKKTVEEVSRTADKVEEITSVSGDDTAPTAHDGVSIRDIVYANGQALLVNLVMIIFLLYFFLSWGRAMLFRISTLLGDRARRRCVLKLSIDLEKQVSSYLLSITLINIGLGLAVAAAMYLLGMQNPPLWGAIAGLLNYIPYLGAVTTAALLAGAALLTFDSLVQAGGVVAVFLCLTILEGQVITPLLLGRHLALNPLVIFLSVAFWFWIWGIMGALMAVPLLVLLKTAGNHLPAVRPLALLTGR